ncbi:hypothetical protein GW17_00023594 [Ensete ventricosum]|nr:hypothetical protein GW17_00023594 [Ensete ventricosum]
MPEGVGAIAVGGEHEVGGGSRGRRGGRVVPPRLHRSLDLFEMKKEGNGSAEGEADDTTKTKQEGLSKVRPDFVKDRRRVMSSRSRSMELCDGGFRFLLHRRHSDREVVAAKGARVPVE